MNKKIKQSVVAVIVIVALVVLDQWTKMLAIANLKGKEAFVLIKDVFEFRYLENTGAAFSSMTGKTTWLLCSTLILMLVVSWFYVMIPPTKKWTLMRWCLVAIVAGGIGNYIDRFRLKYVVDFIYFKLINFPTFNVADCYVTVAVFGVFIMILFVYKDADYEEVKERMPKWLRRKKKENVETEEKSE